MKALAVVIAYTYAPILFPVASGLCVGFEIGYRVSPYILAKGMDNIVGSEGKEE